MTYRGVLDEIAQVPYRLPELIDGVRSGKIVYHLEGPKDVETARGRLGVVATTSGSASSWRPEFRAHYTGADVVVIPDNDAPGRKYADTVARDLLHVARSVKVVELPGLEEGETLPTGSRPVAHRKSSSRWSRSGTHTVRKRRSPGRSRYPSRSSCQASGRSTS